MMRVRLWPPDEAMTFWLLGLSVPVAILLAGIVYQTIGLARDARRYPPPGQLIQAGDYRLHLVDRGHGSPTVVLEAGIAASSISWRPIQEALAAETRVCSYDRAGLGWSESPSEPRTAIQMVEDLRLLLRNGGVPGPYVLVGHSYGGLLVRLFAQRYPAETAGLVLVDPVPLHEWSPLSSAQQSRLARGVRLSRRGAWLAEIGLVRFSLALALSGLRSLPKLIARAASSGKGASVTQRLANEVGKLPPDLWPIVRAHWCHPKSFRSMAAHLAALPASAAIALEAGPLPDIPVVVLSAAHVNEPVRAEHAALGVHRMAERSGHWIHLDEPELVLHAIREVIAAARHPQSV